MLELVSDLAYLSFSVFRVSSVLGIVSSTLGVETVCVVERSGISTWSRNRPRLARYAGCAGFQNA